MHRLLTAVFISVSVLFISCIAAYGCELPETAAAETYLTARDAAKAPVIKTGASERQAEPESKGKAEKTDALKPLSVKGTQITDSDGNAVQLKGLSTHGLAWYPQYVNREFFKELHDRWGADLIRLAMYTAEYGGYCSGGNKDELKKLIRNGVDYAAEAGLYVIIDWHVLSDPDPNLHKNEAIVFFDEISRLCSERTNVLYEICNEPNGGTSWKSIKAYAEDVIPVIRKNDPDAIIIVGTPNWSRFVDEAAEDPIRGYGNIMYSLHFYADTHKDDLRNRMAAAIESGLPVFVTEYGICDASGSGNINTAEADKWMKLLDRYKVSSAMWSLSNKNEAASVFRPGCKKTSGFTENDLSETGKWIWDILSDGGTLPDRAAVTEKVTVRETSGKATEAVLRNDNVGLTVKAELSDEWESSGEKYYLYRASVKNDSGKDINGWEIKLTFDGNIKVTDSWNGAFTASGNTLSVKNTEYNATVPKGGIISDVGFIVKGGRLAN